MSSSSMGNFENRISRGPGVHKVHPHQVRQQGLPSLHGRAVRAYPLEALQSLMCFKRIWLQ
eukprot:16057375-Heterocapsa_arctica.AAC.1